MIRLSATSKDYYLETLRKFFRSIECSNTAVDFISRKNTYFELYSASEITFELETVKRLDPHNLSVFRNQLDNLVTEKINSMSDLNISLDIIFLEKVISFFQELEICDEIQILESAYDQKFWELLNFIVFLKFILLRWTLRDKSLSEETFTKSIEPYLVGYSRNYSFSLWRMYLMCQKDTNKMRFYGRDGQQAFVERLNTSNDVGYSEQVYTHILDRYYKYEKSLAASNNKPLVAKKERYRTLAKLNNAYLFSFKPDCFSGDRYVSDSISKYVDFLFDRASFYVPEIFPSAPE